MKGSTKASMLKALQLVKSKESTKKERVRKAIVEKSRVVEEIKQYLSKYGVIAIFDLEGIPSSQYKKIKSELERYGPIKVYKNNVFLRAAKDVGIPGIDELAQYLTGVNAFLFTEANPYEVALKVEKVVAPKFAKPGDKAESDIYVPEGPTGIPPGPMLSVFGKLKIRTQVREGIIWIAKETKVAGPGDEISSDLASLLRKLGIKPIMVRLKIKAVWDRGKLYSAEDLRIDVESFKGDVLQAVAAAREVAVEAAMPLPDIMPLIISRAYRRAEMLAAEAGFVTPSTAESVFRVAVGRAMALAVEVVKREPEIGIEVAVQAPQLQQETKAEEKKEEEEEEEKEVSEEEIAEGIGSLFG
ncbi:MAG: 50S ribosomal protein L10 [Desulfurococcales archaeon]|nr:50S ribosomal protein L10 [Desulfurococcales archaeon]